MKKRPIIFMVLISLCSILLSACSGILSQATPTSEPKKDEEFIPIVSVTGKVLPKKWSNLSMSTDGIVAEVAVEEGQKVTNEQLLVRLEGKEKHEAAIALANQELIFAQKDLDDLTKNLSLDRQQALIDIAQAYEALRSADRQLYYFTVPGNQRDLDMFSAADKMQGNLISARKTWDPYKYVEEFLPVRNRFDLKKKLDDAEGDFRISMLRITYAANAGMAQAKLERARQDYKKMQEGPDPEKVKLAEARLQNAKSALAAAETSIKDLELYAPFSGEISRLNVRDHEWVSPGQTVIIISDPSSLQVETTDLGEIDVARVKVGNPVKLTFDALPDLYIKGEVVRIAPKNTETSGVNYTVVIKPSELNSNLRWGMTAFADIEVGK